MAETKNRNFVDPAVPGAYPETPGITTYLIDFQRCLIGTTRFVCNDVAMSISIMMC